MTPEQLVLTYLRGEGADVADAEWHVKQEAWLKSRLVCYRNGYPDPEHDKRDHALYVRMLRHSRAFSNACIVAAIRIGFTFKARGKLAPACEYQGRAAIGGTEAEPTSSDPFWALVNFVEAAQ